MFTHSKRLIKLAERLTPVLLEAQVTDISSKNYGNIIMEPKGFGEPCSLAIPIVNFVGMYFHPESKYHKDTELLKRAVLLMDILLGSLHEDGTLDLLEDELSRRDNGGIYGDTFGTCLQAAKKAGRGGQDRANAVREK